MFALAEQYGLRVELEAIHQAVTRLRLMPPIKSIRNKERIQYCSLFSGRRSRIDVVLHENEIGINILHEDFEVYKNLIFQKGTDKSQLNRGENWFQRENIQIAIDALNSFCDWENEKKP